MRLVYVDLKERRSERVVRPLGCFYWGAVWTLAGWCEARAGFRNFRIDRIAELQVLDRRFGDEPGKTLADLLRQVKARQVETTPPEPQTWPSKARGPSAL